MTRVQFDVPINDDDIFEGNEDFTLTINSSSLPDDVTRGNPGSATVTIVDNDRKLCYRKLYGSLKGLASCLQYCLGYNIFDIDCVVYYTNATCW